MALYMCICLVTDTAVSQRPGIPSVEYESKRSEMVQGYCRKMTVMSLLF